MGLFTSSCVISMSIFLGFPTSLFIYSFLMILELELRGALALNCIPSPSLCLSWTGSRSFALSYIPNLFLFFVLKQDLMLNSKLPRLH